MDVRDLKEIADLLAKGITDAEKIKIVIQLTTDLELNQLTFSNNAHNDWFEFLIAANNRVNNRVFELVNNAFSIDKTQKHLNLALQKVKSLRDPVTIIQTMPSGPIVPSDQVDNSIINAYAELYSGIRAREIVINANRLCQQANSDAQTTIKQSSLPSLDVAPNRYWHAVFNEARLHGPKMLTSLLLVVNKTLLPQNVKNNIDYLVNYLEVSHK
ncbi:hypothetical protein [Candidatus Uabimicrobium sp. HlEnr_7]|uniref:hypothetical protein n=1 Tax=Candidatus Uabimicrobium helgolandensis TaxID=3095367 RepID=UPI003555FDB7